MIRHGRPHDARMAADHDDARADRPRRAWAALGWVLVVSLTLYWMLR